MRKILLSSLSEIRDLPDHTRSAGPTNKHQNELNDMKDETAQHLKQGTLSDHTYQRVSQIDYF